MDAIRPLLLEFPLDPQKPCLTSERGECGKAVGDGVDEPDTSGCEGVAVEDGSDDGEPALQDAKEKHRQRRQLQREDSHAKGGENDLWPRMDAG